MAALGDKYFETVPEASSSKRVECIMWFGPTIGTKPNRILNQDIMSLAVTRLVQMIETQEKRVKKLE